MMRRRKIGKRTLDWLRVSLFVLLLGLALVCPLCPEGAVEVDVPLSRGADGIEGLRLVGVVGVKAQLRHIAKADNGKNAVRVTFRKAGEERRLVAMEAVPSVNLSGVRALALRCRISMVKGQAPRLALVVFEKGGGAWFKVGAKLEAVVGFTDVRLPITRLNQAAFRQDPDGQLDWSNVEKVWVGIVVDGASDGSFEVSRAFFTSEPFKASQPLKVTGDGAGVWSLIGKDPAVQATLSTPNEGPGGKPCMKFQFTFPGQRHMYALPSTLVPEAELEGYGGLRFTYKATLPDGISGLLVTLWERDGSQYQALPQPSAREEWTTITIPFDSFQLGGWSKDENKQLDLDQVGTIVIGVHGTAAGAGGSGTIWVADVEFVPGK